MSNDRKSSERGGAHVIKRQSFHKFFPSERIQFCRTTEEYRFSPRQKECNLSVAERERERERAKSPLAAQGRKHSTTIPNQRLRILFPVSRPRQGSRLVLPRGVRGVATQGESSEAKRPPAFYPVRKRWGNVAIKRSGVQNALFS